MESKVALKQRIIKTVEISEEVTYQYVVEDGKKHSEALVASERYFPCVRVKDRCYFGVHKNGRFIPGIIWNHHFIPGILTKGAFIPGVATDSGFKFGIIAFGTFIPGMVIGRQFVHGIVNNKRFIPGCYTNNGKFTPSRFLRNSFDSGVLDTRTRGFINANYEELSTSAISQLVTLEYGINKIRRYEAIGGIPIAGIVNGEFNRNIIVCPSGILTNEWVTIGGLSYSIQEDEIVFDKNYLPHADLLSDLLEALGVDTSGFGDSGWLSTQDEWEELVVSLIEGAPGNAFGDGVDDILVEGLQELGKGSSKLIADLNREYNNYWSNVVASIKASGGIIHGKGSSGGAGGNEEEKKEWYEHLEGAVSSYAVGYKIGSFVGLGVAGGIVVLAIYLLDSVLGIEIIEDKPDGNSSSTSASEGDDGEVNEGNIMIGGWKGIQPIEFKDPSQKESGIRIVYTDAGALMVIDYGVLRDALANGPEEGVSIGLNPLTGETVSIIPGDYDPIKVKLLEVMKSCFINPKTNPTYSTSAPRHN
jgi:hypothetical protein